MQKADSLYEFESFHLDPVERQLLLHDQPVPLPPKAFETLLLLVEHSGHLLTKQELMKRLWPETFVEEANLAQNISAVRRALGERSGGSQYIETVPKAGYRFVAETRTVPRERPSALSAPAREATAGPETQVASNRRPSRWRMVPIAAAALVFAVVAVFVSRHFFLTRQAPVQSIAILPLVNLSGDPTQEYFSDGLTDELITKVAQMGSLHVISRTSVMGYKHATKKTPEIGSELHAESIVEGSVERAGDRVRIRIQLIQASTDRHIWAETYDRELKDVLQLESDVAHEIAERIGQFRSRPGQQPIPNHGVSSEAHENYLRGRYRWNQRNEASLRAGIGHFQRAIELDPVYAKAYAGLADSYIMLANWGFVPPSEGYPRAQAAARRALELDGWLAEAQTSLAYAALLYDWNWPGAESRFRRAIELNPSYATAHHFYSVFLMAAGRHAEAQREIERAREIDPLSPIINSVVGWIYYQGRQYDKAIQQCERSVEMDPNYSPSLLDLGSVYLAEGEHEKALAAFGRARAIAGNTATVLSHLAQGYARSGNTTEAASILRDLDGPANKFVSPWEFAMVHAALGEKDRALTFLEKAADQHAGWIVLLGVDPRLDSLRAEPRFRQLQERIHIPQFVAR